MDKIKGRVKQAAGDITNNKRLKAEGKVDELRGNIKIKIDETTDILKKKVLILRNESSHLEMSTSTGWKFCIFRHFKGLLKF